MAILAELDVAGSPDAWRAAGFAVRDDPSSLPTPGPGAWSGPSTTVGGLRLRLTPPGDDAAGVRGWGLAACARDVPSSIEGLPTWAVDDPGPSAPAGAHPLGIVRLDHLVVLTPDLDRTIAAVESALGIPLRRRRDGPSGSGVPAQQAFFRLGEAILELVKCPPEEPTRFWGLAFETASLDTAYDLLGPDRLREPKPAVQPGRRIASVRSAVGLGFPVALMDTP